MTHTFWVKIPLATAFCMGITACSDISVQQTLDQATQIRVTTVAVRGCGNPSQTMTWIQRPGKQEDSYASTGADICNTMLNVTGQVAASAALPSSIGDTINNQVQSGSTSSAQQTANTNVTVSD